MAIGDAEIKKDSKNIATMMRKNEPGTPVTVSHHSSPIDCNSPHTPKREFKQRFEIVKKLGSGTYGNVSLAVDHKTGEEVAVKIIKKSAIENEQDLLRIRREIRIMSALVHPNIIEIKEGGELYDFVSTKGSLPEDEARAIFRQIVSAVFYCHKHKIAHRDLKLENILLDAKMNAKIADFGLSNYFASSSLLKTFCGSPLYASPEIINGTPYIGPEVDCWSLGVLLYTLVYGSMPFDGRDFNRMIRQIKKGAYYEPDIPSSASMLIRTMLRVNPERRADIEEIAVHWWLTFNNENMTPIPDLPENQILDPTPLVERKETMVVQYITDESEVFAEYSYMSTATRKKIEEFRRRRHDAERYNDECMVSPQKTRRTTSKADKIAQQDPLERLKELEARLLQKEQHRASEGSDPGSAHRQDATTSFFASYEQPPLRPLSATPSTTADQPVNSKDISIFKRPLVLDLELPNLPTPTPAKAPTPVQSTTPDVTSSISTDIANHLINQLLEEAAKGEISEHMITRIQQSSVFHTTPLVREVFHSVIAATKKPPTPGTPSKKLEQVFVESTVVERVQSPKFVPKPPTPDLPVLPDIIRSNAQTPSAIAPPESKPDIMYAGGAEERHVSSTEEDNEGEHEEKEEEEEEEEEEVFDCSDFEDLDVPEDAEATKAYVESRINQITKDEPTSAPPTIVMSEEDDPFQRGLTKRLSRGKYEKSKFVYGRSISIEDSPQMPRKRLSGVPPDPEETERLFQKAKEYIMQYPDVKQEDAVEMVARAESEQRKINWLKSADPDMGSSMESESPYQSMAKSSTPRSPLSPIDATEDPAKTMAQSQAGKQNSLALPATTRNFRILWPPPRNVQDAVSASSSDNERSSMTPDKEIVAAPQPSTAQPVPVVSINNTHYIAVKEPEVPAAVEESTPPFVLQPPPPPKKTRGDASPSKPYADPLVVETFIPAVTVTSQPSAGAHLSAASNCEPTTSSVFTFDRLRSPEPTDICRERSTEPDPQFVDALHRRQLALRKRRERSKTTGLSDEVLFNKAANILTDGESPATTQQVNQTTAIPAEISSEAKALSVASSVEKGDSTVPNQTAAYGSEENASGSDTAKSKVEKNARNDSYRSAIHTTTGAKPGVHEPSPQAKVDPFYSYIKQGEPESRSAYTDGVTKDSHELSGAESKYSGILNYVRPRYNNETYRTSSIFNRPDSSTTESLLPREHDIGTRYHHETMDYDSAAVPSSPRVKEPAALPGRYYRAKYNAYERRGSKEDLVYKTRGAREFSPEEQAMTSITNRLGHMDEAPPIPPRRRKTRSMYDDQTTADVHSALAKTPYTTLANDLTRPHSVYTSYAVPGNRYDHLLGQTYSAYNPHHSSYGDTTTRRPIISPYVPQYRSRFDDNVSYRKSYYDVDKEESKDKDKELLTGFGNLRILEKAAALTSKRRSKSLDRDGEVEPQAPVKEDRYAYRPQMEKTSTNGSAADRQPYISYHFYDVGRGGVRDSSVPKEPPSTGLQPLKSILKSVRKHGSMDEDYYKPEDNGITNTPYRYGNYPTETSKAIEESNKAKAESQSKPLRFVDKLKKHLSSEKPAVSPTALSNYGVTTTDYRYSSTRPSLSSGYSSGATSANSTDKDTSAESLGKNASGKSSKDKNKKRSFLKFAKRSLTSELGNRYGQIGSSDSSGEEGEGMKKKPKSPVDKIKGFFKTKSKENLSGAHHEDSALTGKTTLKLSDYSSGAHAPTSAYTSAYSAYRPRPTNSSYRTTHSFLPTKHWYEDSGLY